MTLTTQGINNIINPENIISINSTEGGSFHVSQEGMRTKDVNLKIDNLLIDRVAVELKADDPEKNIIDIGSLYLLGEGSIDLRLSSYQRLNEPSPNILILHVDVDSNTKKSSYSRISRRILFGDLYPNIYGFLNENSFKNNRYNDISSLSLKSYAKYPIDMVTKIGQVERHSFILRNGMCLSSIYFHNYIHEKSPNKDELESLYATAEQDINDFFNIMIEYKINPTMIDNVIKNIMRSFYYIQNEIINFAPRTDENGKIKTVEHKLNQNQSISRRETSLNGNVNLPSIDFQPLEVKEKFSSSIENTKSYQSNELKTRREIIAKKPSLWEKLFGSSTQKESAESSPIETMIEREPVSKKTLNDPSLDQKLIKPVYDFSQIINDFREYQVDLVKMMQRPVLADLFDEKVAVFDAHCSLYELSDYMSISFEEFHRQWSALKNYADTVRRSKFDKEQKAKISKADLYLAKALNEESTENEKEMSAKALIAVLDGVLPINHLIVDVLKEKVGLKELTV